MKKLLPTYQSIWKLAGPAMLGGIVEPVLSLTDLAVVGNIWNGTFTQTGGNLSAVAAVGIAGSLLSALVWIFAQMKSAISAVVSQAYGAKKMRNMASLILQMIYFNVIAGIFVLLAFHFSSQWVFENLFSASGSVLSDSTAYFNIRILGFPLTLITFSLYGVFRGVQNTWWAMVTSVIGGSVNIILDFVMVLGWGGFCAPMGVEGAAIASVIAQTIMFLLALYFLFFQSKIKLIHTWRINPQFKELLSIAGNLVLRTATLNLALMLTYRLASTYGVVQAATHSVLLNLWLFSAFFLDAFATSANAQGGKFLGNKNVPAMKRNLQRHLLLSVGTATILAIVVLLFDRPIMTLMIDNPKVWGVYPKVLPIFALCLIVNSLAFTLDGIFKGMGKGKFLRNLLFISTGLGFLPAILLGQWLYPGLNAIWIAIVVWMVFRGIIPYFYFRKNLYRFVEG